LPVVRDAPPAEFLAWCAAQRLEVVAATVQGPGRLFEAPLSPRTAILLGSESRGLPPELLTAQVRGVAIPMPGGTESLNVAVAAAVLMYDYRRQHPIRGASPEA
jgi:tRNA G18 (ribose-2'-O)-methylase SpoU